MSATYNFALRRGDTFTHTPILRDKSTGVPVNLTGATFTGNIGGTALSFTLTNPSAGTFNFALTPSQTALLPLGSNKYEVVVTYADSVVQTLLVGNVVVTE